MTECNSCVTYATYIYQSFLRLTSFLVFPFLKVYETRKYFVFMPIYILQPSVLRQIRKMHIQYRVTASNSMSLTVKRTVFNITVIS